MCPLAPIHEWNSTWFITDLASPTLAEQLPDRSHMQRKQGGGGGRRTTITTRKEGKQ